MVEVAGEAGEAEVAAGQEAEGGEVLRAADSPVPRCWESGWWQWRCLAPVQKVECAALDGRGGVGPEPQCPQGCGRLWRHGFSSTVSRVAVGRCSIKGCDFILCFMGQIQTSILRVYNQPSFFCMVRFRLPLCITQPTFLQLYGSDSNLHCTLYNQPSFLITCLR